MSTAVQSLNELIHQLGLERILLLMLAPLFLACMVIESRILARAQRQTYSSAETACNISLALTHAAADGIAWALVLGWFYRVYEHSPRQIDLHAGTLLLLIVLQDFLYYWFHRSSHRIRWMWASHVTHHSSERMNFSTALRQSLTYPISGMWVFWLPLAALGFKPEHVVLSVAISLAFQFFVHTEVIRKLPAWFEAVFNTPSHHRVHHARNPQYLDRNYAGVFIIWDKLFGTFAAEHEPCDYGIVKQIHTRNPVVMMFHEWRDMFADCLRAGPLRLRVQHLWRPPGWQRSDAASSGRADQAL